MRWLRSRLGFPSREGDLKREIKALQEKLAVTEHELDEQRTKAERLKKAIKLLYEETRSV